MHRLSTSFLILLFASPASAQLAPEIGYVFPAGGKAGTTVTVHLGGAEWTPDMQFFVHDPRVKLEVLGPPSELHIPAPPYWFGAKGRLPALPLLRERPARFILPASLPPGPIRWQAANANGATATGIFIVVGGNEILEDEKRKTPQLLPALPVTVNGRLGKNEEVDLYRLKAAAAGPITCELAARRLGANFNAVIEIRDESHGLIAECVDTEGTDPAVTFVAVAGAEYTIAVHDIDHAGDRSFTYRLEVRAGPRIVATVPALGQRGSSREVEFLLAAGPAKIESIKRTVAFPPGDATSFSFKLETPFGPASHVFPLSDLPELVGPAMLAAPGAITGILDKADAEATHTITGKKGDRWSIRAEAHRFGSTLDPAIRLLGPDGKQLAANDDLPGSTDAGLEFTVPADGGYRVLVGDKSGSAGSRTAVYRLSVRTPVDGFALSIPAQKLNVLLGSKTPLVVKAARTGNFKGPIALAISGLPAGIAASPLPLVIPADKSELAVALTVAPDAAVTAGLFTITGTADVGGKPMKRIALAPLPLTSGNLVPGAPEDHESSELLVAMTMKPRVKGAPVDKDTGRKVPRGSTHPADIALERLEGYTGEITLRQAARQSYQVQGITGRDLVVPAGTVKAAYPCFMPEWLETSRTSRMGIVAEVKIADPKGNVRTLVAPIAGFVTMTMEGALLKLSHAEGEVNAKPGEPLVVKVKLARSPRLVEPVKLELIAPPELAGAVMCEPIVVPTGQTEAAIRITVLDPSRLAGEPIVTIRGTAVQPGDLKVVSETTVRVTILKNE
jgi:hypothetical protein